jgi:small subunit ribosomal protein S3
LRADIDYGTGEAKTTYGVIGIKVWVYKGDVVPKSELQAALGAAPVPEPTVDEVATLAKKAKKPAPKFGARKAPAKEKTEGAVETLAKPVRRSSAAAKKAAGDAKPKTTIKRVRKVVKPEENPGSASGGSDGGGSGKKE